MYRCYRAIVPMASCGRMALCAVPRRNLWAFPRSDVRLMLRDVDRQMDNLEREMQSFFRGFPSISLLPRSVLPQSLPVEAVETTGNTYRINIDVSGFKPEDIKLALKDRLLTVEAKMEQKSDDGSRLYQEMTRAYTIPENVEVANLKSLLTSDGVLAIEAPLSETTVQPKEIPIHKTEEIASK